MYGWTGNVSLAIDPALKMWGLQFNPYYCSIHPSSATVQDSRCLKHFPTTPQPDMSEECNQKMCLTLWPDTLLPSKHMCEHPNKKRCDLPLAPPPPQPPRTIMQASKSSQVQSHTVVVVTSKEERKAEF